MSTAGAVSRIDPISNTTETIDLGVGVGDHSLGIAVDDATGSVWASVSTSVPVRIPHRIGRIDPTTSTFSVVTTVIGAPTGTLAARGGPGWFADSGGTVVRLDARTGRSLWRGKYAIPFRESAVGSGAAWLASASLSPQAPGNMKNSGGAITPISMAANEPGETVSVGGGPTGVVVLDHDIYVSDALGVIHPYVSGAVLPEIPVGGEATGIAAGQGFIWVSVNAP